MYENVTAPEKLLYLIQAVRNTEIPEEVSVETIHFLKCEFIAQNTNTLIFTWKLGHLSAIVFVELYYM